METPTVITLHAVPGTDIWRKPPATDDYDAPTATPPSQPSFNPLKTFRSATITFRLAYQEQYDQAGLLLALSPPSMKQPVTKPPKWIKTGIEFYNGHTQLSTVACDAYADWSVAPADDLCPIGTASSTEKEWVTVKVVAEGGERGRSFWVYRVMEDKTEIPLREICWVATGDMMDWNVGVFAMAARPTPNPRREERLHAEFKDFEVAWD